MRDLKTKKISVLDRLRTTNVRSTEKKELSQFWQGVDRYVETLAGIIKLIVRLPLACLVAVQSGLEAFFQEMGK